MSAGLPLIFSSLGLWKWNWTSSYCLPATVIELPGA